MAYFKWRGIDLTGTVREGKQFARSEKELSDLLLDHEIALVSCAHARSNIFSRSISLETKITFFRQLSVLLDAGVMLPEALHILTGLIYQLRMQEILCEVAADVQEGFPLSKALEAHPETFDSLMIRMARIGQEAGTLALALAQLSDYLEATQSFRKKLKSAAMLPMLTFGFFLVIAGLLFTVIVPRFADIFHSMNKELPYLTKLIVNISQALCSSTVFYFLGALLLFGTGIWSYAKSVKGKIELDRLVLRVPWLGDLVKNSSLVYFLHSVSMLLSGGVQLVKAMHISCKSIKNSLLQKQVAELEAEVKAGVSLSQAMKRVPGSVFEADLVAIAKVGEESGRLDVMLKKGAAIYQAKVDRAISFFSTIFQPLLMIILGLLISLLIFAIYLPIFSMSNIN